MTKKLKTLENRLEVDAELFYFDGNSIMEKTKVVAVDKAAKTATLANQVVVSRYPNHRGEFPVSGFHKGTPVVTLMDEDKERLIQAKIYKQKLIRNTAWIQNKFLDKVSNILKAKQEDLELLIKLSSNIDTIINN